MIEINLSLQNIQDGRGIEIAIIGMLVVFTALASISAFISLLPSVLRIVNFIYPIKDSGFQLECSDTPNDEVLAAIGSVLHSTEIGKQIHHN
ncbi:MAG: OadG family protein [Candidatus Brocadiales bacterium]|nr:OadG family protein [Candidatus Brocadiales bacterium]